MSSSRLSDKTSLFLKNITQRRDSHISSPYDVYTPVRKERFHLNRTKNNQTLRHRLKLTADPFLLVILTRTRSLVTACTNCSNCQDAGDRKKHGGDGGRSGSGSQWQIVSRIALCPHSDGDQVHCHRAAFMKEEHFTIIIVIVSRRPVPVCFPLPRTHQHTHTLTQKHDVKLWIKLMYCTVTV